MGNKSLTMTYFHGRTSTIIGAKAFHGPVRDGKAWVHFAMVVKRNLLRRSLSARRQSGSSTAVSMGADCGNVCCLGFDLLFRVVLAGLALNYNHQGYRIKPHGQLVLVS